MNAFARRLLFICIIGFSWPATAGDITNAQLFAWAAASYPQYFSGVPVSAQFPPYDIRFYPGSQTFLAADTSGNVYILGPATGNALVNIGAMSSFAAVVTSWLTTQANPANFAGTYYGQYNWSPNGSGPWTMVITTAGAVSGQGTVTCTGPCTNAANYPLSGSISAGGTLSFSTSGGDTCNGTYAASSGGTLSGTCSYAFNGSTGQFSGVRQMWQYSIQIEVTGSTAHVTNVNLCATVYGNDSCGPNGGFAVGKTDTISAYGSEAGGYTVYIPTNQPAAAYCAVTSGSSGTFGASMPTAKVTCQ